MRGRKETAVMGIFRDCDPCRRAANAVVDQLGAIGIEVDVEEFDNPWDAARNGEGIDLIDGGTTFEVLDPASFLEALLLQDIPRSWLPPSVGAAVERNSALSGPLRVRQANGLADQLAQREVPAAAVGVPQVGGFFSPELGCRIFPPLGYGIDLAAMCLEN